MSRSTRSFQMVRSIALPRAAVWHLLANTDHLNRAIGLPEVSFGPISDDPKVLWRDARTRIAGLKLRYREYPFEWQQGHEYVARRLFESGPFAELHAGIRLRDGDRLRAAGISTEIEAREFAVRAGDRRHSERRGFLRRRSEDRSAIPAGRERRRDERRHQERRRGERRHIVPAFDAMETDTFGVDAEAIDTTEIEIFALITPANAAGEKLAGPFAMRSIKQTWEYVQKYFEGHDAASTATSASTSLPLPLQKPRVDRGLLESGLRLLTAKAATRRYRVLDPQIIENLGRWLRERGDDEVASIKPFALAREWKVDRDEALRVCLYAVKAGLLNLSWNLMCPNCRVSKSETETMSGVESPFHCDLCGVEYSANFDRYVELRFRPHSAVRAVNEAIFCIGGPSISPHVLLQSLVPAHDYARLPFPQSTQALRLRVLRTNHSIEFAPPAVLCADDAIPDDAIPDNSDAGMLAARFAPPPQPLEFGVNGWNGEAVLAPPSEGFLTLSNRSENDILVAIERIEWDADAVTAAHVTSMNEFRDLFGSEVLAPGQHIGVENLTIMFSDLKDSTAMYEDHGDAAAFGRVRSHFDYVFEHVEANRGAIVKTLGDAVMAVFQSPDQALHAALDMQKHVHEFNAILAGQRDQNSRQSEDNAGAHPVVLKIGLHHGPAIAVNSNDRLDYFGRTVNLASRIQGASLGQDIVISGEVWQRPAAQKLLRDYDVRSRHFLANLKGIADILDLYRIEC